MIIKPSDYKIESHAMLKLRYMGKQDKKTEPEHGVKTPPPPQVIDPSSPPGKGRNEDFGKGKPTGPKKER